MQKYVEDFREGKSGEINISHYLNTREVIVSAYAGSELIWNATIIIVGMDEIQIFTHMQITRVVIIG